jgi:hypothetical protein
MDLILEKELINGIWKARIWIDETRTQFFFFTGEPTEFDAEIVRTNFLSGELLSSLEQGVLNW